MWRRSGETFHEFWTALCSDPEFADIWRQLKAHRSEIDKRPITDCELLESALQLLGKQHGIKRLENVKLTNEMLPSLEKPKQRRANTIKARSKRR